MGRALLPWLSPLALLVLWQALSSLGVLQESTLASPVTIAGTVRDLVTQGLFGSTLQQNTLVSAQRALLGFAIGAALAIVLALPAGLSAAGALVIDPPMQMLRMLPHLGLIPLFILWMGLGEQPKIALVAFGSVFPLYLNLVAGIRGVDRKIAEAATSMRLSRWQRIRYVVLPGAMPHAMTGLRQSLGVAWLTLIVAEQIAADRGIGKMIMDAREFLMNDVIVVGLVVYMLLGLLTDALVRLVERRVLAWRA
ncbi:ABC transporter permease [Nocardioides acrostichi]|uniref:ABC transporter permease n=1 Tax=Nocardioides acrostichi TaxID=2784339 RepID=UPI001A9C9809|nr:ABC transporter permease [Nocardioides acrostichi]